MLPQIGPDDNTNATGDDAIVSEAVERWKSCKDWQGVEDERAREDIKFANGDARNRWQWESKLSDERDGDGLPVLTINNTRVHNDLIINEMSKQAYGVKVRPTGGKASYESAQAMMSLIRRIEYISKASTQYRKVAEQQVDGGIGYILISTAYASEKTFDQDIFLKASRDPTAVYLDPWITEPDGSDAKFGFEFEKLPRKEFNKKYPEWAGKVGQSPLTSDIAGIGLWLSDKEIMLAKYWRKSDKKDTLVGWKDDDGADIEKLKSEIIEESGREIYKQLIDDIKEGVIDGKTRKVNNPQVEWFLIAGNTIIDNGDWAGRYIPICRCPGRELVIDNILDRKGHTRPLINAQHMLNYSACAAVQYVSSAQKAQWLSPARAMEGQEQWKDGNVKNYSNLIYNDIDDEASEGNQRIDPPQRIEPGKAPPGHIAIMQEADQWMSSISGQWQAQMGENDGQAANSGKGIAERQQQGDTATYHFPEHQSDMKRFIGVQLIDLIPKIYDTNRTLQVMDAEGTKRWLKIDPDLESPTEELQHEMEDEEAIALAFNPSVGEYECVSDPGPDYATQRQEAWNAFSLIMQQNQWVASCAADLLMKAGDFPGAEELAERLQKEIKAIKPYLFDDKKDPELATAQQQLQRLTALNAELMNKLALKELALKGRDEKRDIDAFKADTDRMKAQIEALAKLMLTPQQKAQMEHEITMAGHEHVTNLIESANQGEIDMQAQNADQAHQAGMQANDQAFGAATAASQQSHEGAMADKAIKAKPKPAAKRKK
jgi:hypothetical protein